MNYADAFAIASDIVRQLAPHCEPERCFIAGSVRRKVDYPGDIEIVAQPKIESAKDLFGENQWTKVDMQFSKIVESLGKVVMGSTEGRMMKIELPYEFMMLDLFLPQPSDFFRQYAIRTGSREYSQFVIAAGWRRKGYVGTKDGLRLEEQCVEKTKAGAKSVWQCTVSNPTLPPVWTDEKHFFEWLGVPYLEPEKRVHDRYSMSR